MLRNRWTSRLRSFRVYALVAALLLPSVPTRATEQAVDLDGNPLNGAESRVSTRVLQSYPVKIENVVYNNATGESYVFEWDGAGPGGFDSFVVPGPDVGTKWEWTTVSQVYSIQSVVTFRLDSRGLPSFGGASGGVQLQPPTTSGTFLVPGKSIFPTTVTLSSTSLTSSLITFFSPEKEVANCGGSFQLGRSEQTITNTSNSTVTMNVEQPACCPEAHMLICEDGCQFYLSDPLNCGACGNECAFDERCDEGACKPICPEGQILCGETCVDPANDNTNCGGCGITCAFDERCDAGSCEPICPPGQTLCGETCVDLASDPANCGACGTTCAFDQVCTTGECKPICEPGLSLCDGACVDFGSDEANCGGCGVTCAADEYCGGGTCTPICPGQTLCGATCVDLTSDEANCGACGTTCASDQFCGGGTCTAICPGETLCGDTCADLQNDPLNCGACGNVCASNSICTDGACQRCRPPKGTNCDNRCVSLHTDPFNCGECGHACDFSGCPSEGQGTCSQGDSCVCDPLTVSSVAAPSSPAESASGREGARRLDRAAPDAAAVRGDAPRTSALRSSAPTSTTTTVKAAVEEAPVCSFQPLQQTLAPGESFTRCTAGSIVGREVFTNAVVEIDGKVVAEGPCALIAPDETAEVPPASVTAAYVIDSSGDGLCQPGETCSLHLAVQNLLESTFASPVGRLSSAPDEFNPLGVVFLHDLASWPDLPGFAGSGSCETAPVLDPQTNTAAFQFTLPAGQAPDVGRVFSLELRDQGGEGAAIDLPFVLGVGAACNPQSVLDGETYDGLVGLLDPVNSPLVPKGTPVSFSTASLSRNNTLPLKLRLACGGRTLGGNEIDPTPEIVELDHETLGPQPLVNINSGDNANPSNPAFNCGSSRCEFQLRTKDLPLGVYVISIKMPDSRVFQAGFTVSP